MREIAAMEETVVGTLSYYRKESDSPSGGYPLSDLGVEELRGRFHMAPEDPMFDVYPVGPEQAAYLQAALRRDLDLEAYDYFVECHAAG